MGMFHGNCAGLGIVWDAAIIVTLFMVCVACWYILIKWKELNKSLLVLNEKMDGLHSQLEVSKLFDIESSGKFTAYEMSVDYPDSDHALLEKLDPSKEHTFEDETTITQLHHKITILQQKNDFLRDEIRTIRLKNRNLQKNRLEGMQKQFNLVHIDDIYSFLSPMVSAHSSFIYQLQCLSIFEKELVASLSYNDKELKLWDLTDISLNISLDVGKWAQCFSCYKVDGVNFLAVGHKSHEICLWNLETMKKIVTLDEHSEGVSSLTSFKDGEKSYLLSGSDDCTIKLWDIERKQSIATMEGHKSTVHTMKVFEDSEGFFLASGSGDKTVKIWNLYDHKLVGTLSGHSDAILSLEVFQYNNNALMLASGSADKNIRLWELGELKGVGVLSGHNHNVSALGIVRHKGKECLISGSWDKTIKIWSLRERKVLRTILNESSGIRSLSMCKANSTAYFVSGDWNGKLRVWKQ